MARSRGSSPRASVSDLSDAITGTDKERFEIALHTLIPALRQESPPLPGVRSVFNLHSTPPVPIVLDVVEFAGQHIAEPSGRLNVRLHTHEHLSFEPYSKHLGRKSLPARTLN